MHKFVKRFVATVVSCSLLSMTIPVTGISAFAASISDLIPVKDSEIYASTKDDTNSDFEFSELQIGNTFNLGAEVSSTYSTANTGFGSLSYSSSNTAVCTVDASGNVTITGVGTAVITINAAETDDYLAATTTVTITVGKDAPAIQLGSNITKTYGDTAFQLSYTVNSNVNSAKAITDYGGLTWSSSNTGVCTVDGTGKVTVVGVGSSTITASAAGNSLYNSSSDTVTITVQKANPSLSVSGIASNYCVGDGTATVTASASSGGAISISSSNSDVISVSGNTLIIKKAGTTTISVTSATTANYNSVVKNIPVTVNKMATANMGSILSVTNTSAVYGPGSTSVSLAGRATTSAAANAPAPTGAITYSFNASDQTDASLQTAGSVSGTTFNYTRAGSYVLRATLAADSNYSSISKTFIVTVSKGAQSISVANLTKTYQDANFSLSGHASLSVGDGAITYSIVSQTPNQPGGSVVSLSGNTVTIQGAGSAIIRATAAETTSYATAYKDFTITINRKTPTLTAAAINKTYLDPVFSLSGHVVSNSSEGAITYSIASGDSVSLSGANVTLLKSGVTTINVVQAQSANWNAASTSFIISVARANPTFSTAPCTATYGDGAINLLNYIMTNSDATPVFSLAATSATDVISVSGTSATILNSGMATVVVSLPQTDKFLASAEQSFTVTIGQKSPGIDPNGSNNVATGISKTYLDPNFSVLEYFTTDSDGTKSYASSDPNVLSIAADGTITVGVVGTATITVTIAETRNFTATTFNIQAEVKRALPIMSALTLQKTYLDAPVDLTSVNGHNYVTSNSPGTITYNIKSGEPQGVASITNNVISFLGYGAVIVVATQEQTDNFLAYQIEFSVAVDRATPINQAQDVTKTYLDPEFSLAGHCVTSSNGAVTYSVINETGRTNATTNISIDDVVDIDGNVATVKNAGTAIVRANIAETAQYAAAYVDFEVSVLPKTPTSSAANISKIYLDMPFSLTGHLVTESDGTVTYSSENSSIVSIVDDQATINHAGTVVITATSSETQNYLSKDTTFEVFVDKAQSILTGTLSYEKKMTDSDFYLDAATTSSCPMTFSSNDTNVATVDSDGLVHIVAVGTTTITVTLAEDENYYGTSMDVTVTFIRDTPTLTGADIEMFYADDPIDMIQHMSYNGDGTFSYSEYDSDIISITNHFLTAVNTGTTSLKITSSETPIWNSVNTTITITVKKGTITSNRYHFDVDSDGDGYFEKTYEDPDFNLNFTSTSDGVVTYTSSDPTVATVDTSGTMHLLKAGSTMVTVNISETRNWNSASIPITLKVHKCAVRFENADEMQLTCKMPDFLLPVTWNSNGSHTCISGNTAVLAINSFDIISVGKKGTTTLTIRLAETDQYLAGEVIIPVTVTIADSNLGTENPDIDPDNNIVKYFGDPDFSLEIVHDSDAKAEYTSSDTGVATISTRGRVHIVAVGQTDLTVHVPETDFYSEASVTFHLTVKRAVPIITGGDSNGIELDINDPPYTPDISVSTNADPEYRVEPEGIIEVLPDGTIKPTIPGETELIITYPGTETTEPVEIRIPIIVLGKQLSFIGKDLAGVELKLGETGHTLAVQPDITNEDPKPTLTMTYQSQDTNIVTIDNSGVMTPVSVGDTFIKVELPFQSPYVATSVLIPVTVVAQELHYSSESTIRVRYGDPDFSVYPILFDRAAAPNFTFTSSDENILTVSDRGVVTLTGVGSAVVTAHCDAFENYGECNIQTAIVVSKGDPELKVDGMTLTIGDTDKAIGYTCTSDGEVSFTTTNTTNIKLVGDKISALSEGAVSVTAKVTETALYNEANVSFTVTVNPNAEYNVSFADFTNLSEPMYNSDLDLRITVRESLETKTLPVVIYYLDGTARHIMHQQNITAISGTSTATDFTVNTGNLVGRVTLYAQLATDYDGFDSFPEDNTMELEINIPEPSFRVAMGDIPDSFTPGQYISIPYYISGTDIPSDMNLTVKLSINGATISTGYISINSDMTSYNSVLSGFIPADLAEGDYVLDIQVIPNISLQLDDKNLKATKKVHVQKPNLGLLLNSHAVNEVDSYLYAASSDSCEINLQTASSYEKITSILYDGKKYSINDNKTTFTANLAKSESVMINVTVESACQTVTKEYTLTVTRGNDDTSFSFKIVTDNNVEYEGEIINGEPIISLPVDDITGTLILDTEDPNAKIVKVDTTEINSNHAEVQISINSGDNQDIAIEIAASDTALNNIYTLKVVNKNISPDVELVNADEVMHATYGSKGVKNYTYVEYGPSITSVELAKTSGKLHGVIIDIIVADTNYQQYLAGYLTVEGVNHPIHWGSFDGETVIRALDAKHGYIYIDSTYFKSNAEDKQYTLVVCDYADALSETPVSSTTLSLSFAVNVIAPDFSAYFDADLSTIQITSDEGNLSFRKSLDGGITWTESVACSSSIEVMDIGTSLYEITLTDDMNNSTVKTVTAVKIDGSIDLSGVNVYSATSRNADYIYINTKKSNSGTVNAGIVTLFSSSAE